MTRVRALLLIAVAAVAPATSVTAGRENAGVPHMAAVMAIDLPALFGEENEPDENESDEGAPRARPAKPQRRSRGRSIVGVPLRVALPVLAGMLALAGATALVVRWV